MQTNQILKLGFLAGFVNLHFNRQLPECMCSGSWGRRLRRLTASAAVVSQRPVKDDPRNHQANNCGCSGDGGEVRCF